MRIQTLLSMTLLAVAIPSIHAQEKRVALHATSGPELSWFAVDVAGARLQRQGSVTLPENVQEAWPHPSRQFLYVAWSNNARGTAGRHGMTAFRVDAKTGALSAHGDPVKLAARSVFLTVDGAGQFAVVAYNDPSSATVHRIASDGKLADAVTQPAGLDFGVYAHQVRVDASGRMVVVVTRGNGPEGAKKEDPGALKVFAFAGGLLRNKASIAPGGGHEYQPRHLDFHPALPLAYVTLERQNKLQVYRVTDGPSLSAEPLFTKDTLLNPAHWARQATSAIHVHPNGRFVYLGNRATAAGAENSIAVYAIDNKTGEPSRIQNADTHGAHPRTFALDPTGRLLVVANMQHTATQAASLAVFRIGSDGRLSFARQYDQDTGQRRNLFWTGMMELP
ncbi:MAG: beta-propeller fold lactonase family protein [Bryobacterales bacterium]|nr:beta-propeller fold lactonase family protein [Bryobacterales bacterium]